MIVTESESGGMWCPFARALGGNRDSAFYSCCCMGSRCMAWRPTTETHGFCGLAGNHQLIEIHGPEDQSPVIDIPTEQPSSTESEYDDDIPF